MKVPKLWWVAVAIIILTIPVLAQNNPNEEQGLKPYDSFQGGDLDSVSLTNGSLVLHIPLASFPQRGNLDLGFLVRYSSKQWRVNTRCTGRVNPVCTHAWVPISGGGAQIGSTVDWVMQSSYAFEPQDPNAPGQTLIDWSMAVAGPDGEVHLFGGAQPDFNGPVYPMRSLDATGLLHPNAQTVILPNGTVYSYPGLTDTSSTSPPSGVRGGVLPSTITDSNGNQITVSSSGWTDTMGRFIPGSANPSFQSGIQPGVPTADLSNCPAGTSSALVWNVPG
ncbi:MAG TPA: hypothetical protein VFB79_19300, partial [Candidatus Angelobacter sp.]|nr:hypothetical protein [Candidatus Angelobacter sp.]